MAQPTKKKSAFVCVPGGFCPSGFFDKTVAEFEKQACPVVAVDLPSIGKRPEGPASLEDDAEEVRRHVRNFADQGYDIVLAGNSYGGWVITEAAKGIGKAERKAEGKSGGVVNLVYLGSGLAAETGKSVSEFLSGRVEVPERPDPEGYVDPPPAEAAPSVLIPSLSQEEQLRYGKMLKHFSGKAQTDPLTYLGYMHIPTTMVIGTNDVVVDPKWQLEMFEAAKARGASVRMVELAGDHCCQLSNPVEVVRICIEAASQ